MHPDPYAGDGSRIFQASLTGCASGGWVCFFSFFLKNEKERKHFFKLCSLSFFSKFSGFPRQASVAQVRTEGSRLKRNTEASRKRRNNREDKVGKDKRGKSAFCKIPASGFHVEYSRKEDVSDSNPYSLSLDVGIQDNELHQEPLSQQQG